MELSIITINLNNKEGLQKTIDSVASQTWEDFEWILIDGGSKDGSKDLIEENQAHFSYWCSEPDKGIYNAMNKGAEKATGDYLLFLNSGDALHGRSVLERVHSAGFHGDIVSGQAIRMDNGELLRRYDEDILLQLYKDTLNHQATFIRRALFEGIRYDESLSIVSDWKFWLEALVIRRCSFETLDFVVSEQDMMGISYSESFKELQNAERNAVLADLFHPMVLNSLQKYLSLTKQPETRNLRYLKNNFPGVFKVLKKIISFVTLVCQKKRIS